MSCPSGTLPDQTETWADLKAAYRLFDVEEVTFKSVTQGHLQQTRTCPVGAYLILEDTTELDFGKHRKIEALGPTGRGTGWGFLLHSGLMVRADSEEIIGLAGQTIHYRKSVPKNESKTARLKRERESKVWCDVIDEIGRPPANVQWTHVLDRGGDNFEVYCHCLQQGTDWVVRASQRQRLVFTPEGKQMPLMKYLKGLDVAGTYELHLRSRPNQPARVAQLEVSFSTIEMPPPKQTTKYVRNMKLTGIRMYVVHVREAMKPRNGERIEWILLTSLPVGSFDDAWKIIGYYEKRWLIEEWHKALKTGCQVTNRQLATKERLEPLVGLLSVVSVRLLQLKSVARTNPDRPAHQVVPSRWIIMLQAARKKKLTRGQQMTVRDFYRELAKLGGFLGRTSDGEPGWITIWRGWEKLSLMIRGADLARGNQKCG